MERGKNTKSNRAETFIALVCSFYTTQVLKRGRFIGYEAVWEPAAAMLADGGESSEGEPVQSVPDDRSAAGCSAKLLGTSADQAAVLGVTS
eukprot:6492116-Amphidinium_carterae.1